jgi:hypothetical protein
MNDPIRRGPKKEITPKTLWKQGVKAYGQIRRIREVEQKGTTGIFGTVLQAYRTDLGRIQKT